MHKNEDRKEPLLITYPGRMGFTIMAHQLLEEISHRFALSGLFEEDPGDCFSIILNGKQIFTCYPIDPDTLDKEAIFHTIGKYLPHIPPNQDRLRIVVQGDGEFPDCFCSGE
jgi:hypothetical protein